jgi:hypothetical protein
MKTRLPRVLTITACIFFAIVASFATAAKAPIKKADLKNESTHIVSATVVEVTEQIKKSAREPGAGNTDKVFTIKVKVDTTEKGEGIAIGDHILILAWKAQTRIGAATIGIQGHEAIPKKGQKATFYLKQNAKTFEPLMPNGIEIDAP